MNPRFLISALVLWSGLAVANAATAPRTGGRSAADVATPQRRQSAMDTAERLVRRESPPPLASDLGSPFNPAGFDEPDPSLVPPTAGPRGSTPGSAPAAPATDRDILETLAARLNPSGTFMLGGKPLLIIDRNRFEVGTKFIVTYNDRDFELQLVSIDRTTFTLRYRGEEITRPIKPVK